MLATRDDIIQCYERILGRLPENETVIAYHLSQNRDLWDVIQSFLNTDERKMREDATSFLSIHKCFRGEYLARRIERADRPRIFIHNLAFVSKLLHDDAFEQMVYHDAVVYNQGIYEVTIQFSREIFIEGELSLYFRVERDPVYVLSFTFVPGETIGLAQREAVLISRMQGLGRKLEKIRQAAKAMGEISPQSLLFSTLEGIATASGIGVIAGTAAVNHVCYVPGSNESFSKNYDAFFESQDAVQTQDDLYVVELPRTHKSIGLIKAVRRLRTRSKRKMKSAIAEAAGRAWGGLFRTEAVPIRSAGMPPVDAR